MTNRIVLGHILFHLRPYKWSIGIVILALSLVAGSILSLGKAVKLLIDSGLKAQDVTALNSAILYIITLILVLGLASFIRSYFINSIGEKVVSDIRQKVYAHLLTLRYRQFERLKVSDIVSRLSNDIELTSRIIVDTFSFCIRNAIMFCGGVVLMFGESAKLSLMVLIIVPLILVALTGLGRKVRGLSRDNQENLAALSEFIGETFSGVKAIYAANAQESKRSEISKISDDFLNSSLHRLRMRALFFALAISAIMCSITVVIWIGSKDVLDGSLSSGQLVSFIFYAASSALSIGGIAEVFGDLQRSLAASERIFAMLEIDDCEVVSHDPSHHAADKTNDGIAFKNLSFTYPARPEVQILRALSLEIGVGEFVGIVGRSGSGKSTIMQLLLKFFETEQGQILLGDLDIKDIDPIVCRRMLGYVPQDPFMFSATIRDNLVLNANNEGELQKVIKATGLDEVLKLMPKGLDTYIGAKGSELSGGQRQRIAIARALLLKPQVLLLDEATSALDQTSERMVVDEIKKMMTGRSIVSIAHRISSVQNADRILVIDEGKVLASGSHEELLKSCTIYKKLCNEEL